MKIKLNERKKILKNQIYMEVNLDGKITYKVSKQKAICGKNK